MPSGGLRIHEFQTENLTRGRHRCIAARSRLPRAALGLRHRTRCVNRLRGVEEQSRETVLFQPIDAYRDGYASEVK